MGSNVYLSFQMKINADYNRRIIPTFEQLPAINTHFWTQFINQPFGSQPKISLKNFFIGVGRNFIFPA